MTVAVTNRLIEETASPLISVAMPVFNGEKYLAAAIASILAQTFKDFELIIIDDGSTDDSLALIKTFEIRDLRIRVISRENRNLVATLNDIIDLSRGKWIARMDQDDIALPHRFERQLQWIKETNADICGSWVELFGATGKRTLKHAVGDAAVKMEILFCTPFAHPSVMINKISLDHLRYEKAWEKCEDYDLWERAAMFGLKMTNVPEVLLLYRQHNAQISSAASLHQHQLAQKIRLRYWTSIFKSLNFDGSWINDVLQLREPVPAKFNMGNVDAAMTNLLLCTKGEAQATVFDHATRLYFRAAAGCPNIVVRWFKLNKLCGNSISPITMLKLQFLATFKLGPDSKTFYNLKSIFQRTNL